MAISHISESPSYIRDILADDANEKITLYFRKLTKLPTTRSTDETNVIDATNTSLDLTGNPLEIDLSGDELGELTFMTPAWKNWTEEESKHLPMTLGEARKLINDVNKRRIKEKNGVQSSYVYCVCDGSDLYHTVVLGAKQSRNLLSRTQIFIKGCFTHNDPLISTKSMEQEHRDNVGFNKSQDQCVVTSTYIVYGRIFKNCSVTSTGESTGCISLELKWNDCEFSTPKCATSQMVIAGHNDSPMHDFWTQLSLLSNYIAILYEKIADLEWVSMSNEPRDYIDISKDVYLILHGTVTRVVKKNLEKADLNLQELRRLTLTDKLWNLLIYCSSVSDLRSCFHILFEELVETTSNKVDISDDNKTTIATIMRDIVSGKLAVPPLTSKQCLELLIELGIEKLKNDYFCIVNHFDCINREKLSNYWSNAIETTETPQSVPLSGRVSSKGRKDEILVLKKRSVLQSSLAIITAVETKSKLNCLVHMHLASDYLLMVKRYCPMRQEAVDSISRCIQDNLLIKQLPCEFSSDLPQFVLHELKVKLKSTDTTFLEAMSPVTWNLKLTSVNNRSTVLTVFHLTSKPIFPPSIYDDYDVRVGADDEQIYYVTKLVSYVENIG